MTARADIYCPKCGSQQVGVHARGLSLKRGVIGAALGAMTLGGPVVGGAVGAIMGSGKAMCSCAACGHQWKPGTVPAGAHIRPEMRGIWKQFVENQIKNGVPRVEAERLATERYR